MASFRWQVDPATQLPINVTVRATNKTILRIVGLKPSSSATGFIAADTDTQNGAEAAATVQFVFPRTNVQWPIYPPNTTKPNNDAPLIGSQEFDTGSKFIQFLKADTVWFDALTFTGDANIPPVYDAATGIIRAPANTTGTVKEQTTLKCP
jgi:hypothetical protein